MNKKVLGIVIALIAIIAIVAVCVILGNKNKEDIPATPVVIVNESGEQEEEVSKYVETDPYNANIPNEIFDFYLEKVDEIEKKHKDDQAELIENNPDIDLTSLSKLKYDLVFFDDDNIPELVVTNTGYNTRLYTFAYEDGGKVIYAMKEEGDEEGEEYGWAYGAGGNHGYEFIPRANVLRNINADHAGLIMYYAFYKLDPDKHNLVDKFDGVLRENHFVDKNGNGEVDEDEMDDYVEEVASYYVGDKKVNAEEAREYVVVSDDFEPLEGTRDADAFRALLQSLVNEK